MQLQGVSFVENCIDDFVTMRKTGSRGCADNIRIMHETCEECGVPVKEKKSEGLTSKLQFLLIEINTMAMELSLPPEKLANLLKLLQDWRGKTVAPRGISSQSSTASPTQPKSSGLGVPFSDD